MMIENITQTLMAERAARGRGDWRIGRRAVTRYITLHWNGPAVAEQRRSGPGAIEQLKIDLDWQTNPNWPGAKGGADGLQYHYAIAADGQIFQCRDDADKLWHCGHAVGNNESLSLHFLLGRGQELTGEQWAAGLDLIERLRRVYDLPRVNVRGHAEWRTSECPGPDVRQHLADYRRSTPPPPPAITDLRRFVVGHRQWGGEWRATVRQGPSRAYPVAGHLKTGAEVFIDVVLPDELSQTIAGADQWAHMARVADAQPDLGFIHLSQLLELT